MNQDWIKFGLLGSSLFLAGCAGTRNPLASIEVRTPAIACAADPLLAEAPETNQAAVAPEKLQALDPSSIKVATRPAVAVSEQTPSGDSKIQRVSHQPKPFPGAESDEGTLTINGQTYRLVPESQQPETATPLVQTLAGEAPTELSLVPMPEEKSVNTQIMESVGQQTVPLDLSSALAMVGGQHPAIGFAQWRVQEAYAQLDQAEILWLPTLQAGFGFHRHDGNYQASNGAIVDVNRSSFQYGLGNGAVGAGTTPRPGIVAQFHMTDAIFQPKIAEKTAWAQGHAATGVYQQQLLDVALAYLNLLEAEQDLTILNQTKQQTQDLAKLTEDFAATGQGLRADADRMKTELALVEGRIAETQERADVAASRLAQELSFDASQRITPADPTVVPIDLVPVGHDKASLISTGLAQRPELKEAQALVAAACEQYQREKYRPFIPSVLLGLSTTGFGGGVGTGIGNVDGRYDFDALMTWEVRNLGFGEQASRREQSARIQQARFEKIRILDQVAREISEAHSQVRHRANRMAITQQAIQSAQDSFERNLSRIRDGQGIPLEVLQSVRALEDAQRAYLESVVDYNEAQFRLQWALGWPVSL